MRTRVFVRDRSRGFVRRVNRVGAGKLKLVGGQARGVRALFAMASAKRRQH